MCSNESMLCHRKKPQSQMHTNLCITSSPSQGDQPLLVEHKPRHLSVRSCPSTRSSRLTPLRAAAGIQRVSAIKSVLRQHAGSSHATGTRCRARALAHPLFSQKQEADVSPSSCPQSPVDAHARAGGAEEPSQSFPRSSHSPRGPGEGGRKVGHLGKFHLSSEEALTLGSQK